MGERSPLYYGLKFTVKNENGFYDSKIINYHHSRNISIAVTLAVKIFEKMGYAEIHYNNSLSATNDPLFVIGRNVYVIARPVNGISLNGDEYLLDKNNKIREFTDRDKCLDFIKENITKDDPEDYLREKDW